MYRWPFSWLISSIPIRANPIEWVHTRAALSDNPGDDRSHGAPRDPQQLRDRRLRRVHRQPRDLLLEVAGEPRPVPRPRHPRHRHAMLTAGDPRRVGLELHTHGAQIHAPPTPPTLPASPFTLVIARRRPLATATPTLLGAPRAHMHDHGLVIVFEPDVLDHRAVV